MVFLGNIICGSLGANHWVTLLLQTPLLGLGSPVHFLVKGRASHLTARVPQHHNKGDTGSPGGRQDAVVKKRSKENVAWDISYYLGFLCISVVIFTGVLIMIYQSQLLCSLFVYPTGCF